jgi:hypothetical protein
VILTGQVREQLLALTRAEVRAETEAAFVAVATAHAAVREELRALRLEVAGLKAAVAGLAGLPRREGVT